MNKKIAPKPIDPIELDFHIRREQRFREKLQRIGAQAKAKAYITYSALLKKDYMTEKPIEEVMGWTFCKDLGGYWILPNGHTRNRPVDADDLASWLDSHNTADWCWSMHCWTQNERSRWCVHGYKDGDVQWDTDDYPTIYEALDVAVRMTAP